MAVQARQSPEEQRAHLDQDYTKNLSAFYVVCLFVVVACMALRVTSRKIMGLRLERDDFAFLTGSTLAIGLFVCSLLYSFDAGLGKHWVSLTPEQQILFPKLNYAFNIFNLSCYPIIKISILLLYLRLFFGHTCFRGFCWAGIAFLTAMGTANTLVTCFACKPIRSFFDFSISGKCINFVTFYWATAVLNVITDIYILILPIPVVMRLRISTKRKVAISLIFMLGGLTFVVSILRILYYLDYTNDDPSYSFLRTAYATQGEVCLAIVVASAATWRPVWTYTYHITLRLVRRLSGSSESFDLSASHESARSAARGEKSSKGQKVSVSGSQASRKTSITYVEEEENIGMNTSLKAPPRAYLVGTTSSQNDNDMSIEPAPSNDAITEAAPLNHANARR